MRFRARKITWYASVDTTNDSLVDPASRETNVVQGKGRRGDWGSAEFGLVYVTSTNNDSAQKTHPFVQGAQLDLALSAVNFGRVKFTNEIRFTYRFADNRHYTTHNEAQFALPIGASGSGWSLTLTNKIDHDSAPDSPKEKDDFVWNLGLKYTM